MKQTELGRAVQLSPDVFFVRESIGFEEAAYLLGIHWLNFDLRHAQFSAAQTGAVIKTAARKYDAVSLARRFLSKHPPQSNLPMILGGALVRH
ncbi:MAG: hypothetical protein AAB401_11550, partial [Acidobacteriota bacterium]